MKHLFRKWRGPAVVLAIAAFTMQAYGASQVQTLGGGPNQAGPSHSGYRNGNTLLNAKFFNPSGVAVDSSGNLYIADKNNNKLRKITNTGAADSLTSAFASRLPAPVGVAVDKSNNVYVVTMMDGKVRKFSNAGALLQTVAGLVKPTALALDGVGNVFVTELGGAVKRVGTNGTVALITTGFNQPRGIAVTDDGLLAISESGGHAIYTVDPNSGATALIAGGNGPGFNNGDALTAQFNQPYGIAAAPNGSLVIADRLNHRVRVLNRLTNGTVSTLYGVDPRRWASSFRGWQDGTGDEDGTAHSREPVGLVVARDGNVYVTETYWDLIRQATETSLGSSSTNIFQDGPSITCPPNITASVTNASLAVVTFTTTASATNAASVVVICQPASGSQFPVGVTTVNCHATDSSHLTNRCSFTVTVVATVSPNIISFGFESGQGSSDFIGVPGQAFYAPVTLNVGQGQSIYSFQMSLSATGETGVALDPFESDFVPMLSKQIANVTTNYGFSPPLVTTNVIGYLPIQPNYGFLNSSINLLGVGWLERYKQTNLYDTTVQDLVTYSVLKNDLFRSSLGRVIMGAYRIAIPSNAVPGDSFLIAIKNPSGTSDGVAQPVSLFVPTDNTLGPGTLNTIKRVTVGAIGSRSYLVGDSTPLRWINAGEFGDRTLANSDVIDLFQTTAYGTNSPSPGSDLFDAMDSSDGLATNLLFDVDDLSINSKLNGDGVLAVDDVFVTFRRSLDPTLKWFARFWSNGVRQVVEVPNTLAGGFVPPAPDALKSLGAKALSRPSGVVRVDSALATAGAVVQLPVRISLSGAYPVRVMMVNVTVEALDGSPGLTTPLQFQTAPAFRSPELSESRGPNNYAAAWLDNKVTGVSGNSILAFVTVRVPVNAGPRSAYRVHFDHFSASPNGTALFGVRASSGLILLSDRSASTWDDGISDEWRLRYFGSISAPESAVTADADADGVLNVDEYINGTDPTDPTSR